METIDYLTITPRTCASSWLAGQQVQNIGFNQYVHPLVYPDFSFDICFLEIHKRYPDHALKDIFKSSLKVIILASENEKKILEEVLTEPKLSGVSYFDSKYNYCVKSDHLLQCFQGNWCANDNSSHGNSIFSLVRTIKMCSEFEAFLLIAKILKVDFSENNVAQTQKMDGHSFIRDAHAYLGKFTRHETRFISIEPTIPYNFLTEYGNFSFSLQEFNLNGEIMQLFVTLLQNNVTGERVTNFIAPPYEDMIYNRHLLDRDNDREVHIHDQISRANSWNTERAISTWSGELSFSFHLNWSLLKGRTVHYIFDMNDLKSMQIGAHLIEQFKKMGTPLKLRSVSKPLNLRILKAKECFIKSQGGSK